jgi:hypothetical protein
MTTIPTSIRDPQPQVQRSNIFSACTPFPPPYAQSLPLWKTAVSRLERRDIALMGLSAGGGGVKGEDVIVVLGALDAAVDDDAGLVD